MKTMKLQDAKEVMKKALLLFCHQRSGVDEEDFFILLACVEGALLKVSDEMEAYLGTSYEKAFNALVEAFTESSDGPGVVIDMEYFYAFCDLLKIRMGSFITSIEGFLHDPHPEAEETLDRMSYTLLWDSRVVRDLITDYGDVWNPV